MNISKLQAFRSKLCQFEVIQFEEVEVYFYSLNFLMTGTLNKCMNSSQ